ncbi:MAG: tetratricopeptide repeat protein [Myxococcota bacterium]
MPLVVVVIILLALPLWFLLRLGRRPAAEPLPEPPVIEDLAPMSAAHDLYVLGEGERNVLFLEAELAWRRQDTAGALRLFERAAAHHWKWQGGAGLLRHGQLLHELGREAAAREAWERCRRQDPESLAAQRAVALLGA